MAEIETIPQLQERHAREERELCRRAMEAHGGNITRAAEALGVSYSTLRSALHRLGLEQYATRGRGAPRRRAAGE